MRNAGSSLKGEVSSLKPPAGYSHTAFDSRLRCRRHSHLDSVTPSAVDDIQITVEHLAWAAAPWLRSTASLMWHCNRGRVRAPERKSGRAYPNA